MDVWIHIWAVQLERLVKMKCLADTHTANEEQSWEEASLTEANGRQRTLETSHFPGSVATGANSISSQ